MNSESGTCNACPLQGGCHRYLEPKRIVERGEKHSIRPIFYSDEYVNCMHFTCPRGIVQAIEAYRFEKKFSADVSYRSGGGPKRQIVATFETTNDKPSLSVRGTNGELSWLAIRVVNRRGKIFSWSPEIQLFLETGQNIFNPCNYPEF